MIKYVTSLSHFVHIFYVKDVKIFKKWFFCLGFNFKYKIFYKICNKIETFNTLDSETICK